MRKIHIYVAMSLDGYLADSNGGVTFLEGDGSDKENLGSYLTFIESVDTIILGNTTYRQIVEELSPDKWVYEGKKTYIVNHSHNETLHDERIFTTEELALLLQRLKAESGKNIWICGGASVINQVIELSLADIFTISIIPIILGNGIKLFDKINFETKLKLKSTKAYNGIVDLEYELRDKQNSVAFHRE